MTARCITCQHFSGKQQSRDLVAQGMFRCTLSPVWVFRSAFKARECSKFAAVEPQALPAREAYEARFNPLPSIPKGDGGEARP